MSVPRSSFLSLAPGQSAWDLPEFRRFDPDFSVGGMLRDVQSQPRPKPPAPPRYGVGTWAIDPFYEPPEEYPIDQPAPSLLAQKRSAKRPKPEDRLVRELIPTGLDPNVEAQLRDHVNQALKGGGLMEARRVLARDLKAAGAEIPEGLDLSGDGLPGYSSPREIAKATARRQRAQQAEERRVARQQTALSRKKAKEEERQKRFEQKAAEKQARAERRAREAALKENRRVTRLANRFLQKTIEGQRLRRLVKNPEELADLARKYVHLSESRGLPIADALLQKQIEILAEEARKGR